MRNFIFSGAYWGIILVLIGLGYVFNSVADKHLPIFRMAVGVVILSIGIQIVYSALSPKKSSYTVFRETTVNHDTSGSYSVVFGATTIDLSNVDLSQGDVKKRIECVFGSAEIYIPRDVDVEIKAETVFGNTESPFGDSSGFGDRKFVQKGTEEKTHRLIIKSECVFGNVEFLYKKAKKKEVVQEVKEDTTSY